MNLTGQLPFAQPALLLGSAVALVPVLIHLLLRPRPRRTRFPAVALLRRAVLRGQRASRLRNLMLLAVRALLLGGVALLLAGPTCRPETSPFAGSQPLACVIILDDSGSASYRLDQDTTKLDVSRQQIREFLGRSSAWPERSGLALVHAGPGAAPTALSEDRAAARAALQGPAPPVHAQPLGAALQTAAELLRAAEQPAKRIVVFTDGAAHAWVDVTSALLAGLDGLVVRVILPTDQPPSNLALLGATGPTRRHPAPAPVPLRASVSAEGLNGECWLLVRQAERTLQRVGPLRVPADTTHAVTVELPAMPPGPHVLTLEIEPTDHLDFDQHHYVAFETAPPPTVWLVLPSDTATGDDLSALIARNLLAPEVLAPEQQLVKLVTCTPERLPGQSAADTPPPAASPPALIVIMSPAEFEPSALAALLRHVERGATAVLLPGSAERECDWPGLLSLLSAAPGTADNLTSTTAIRWEPASRFAAVSDLVELSRCGVRRRVLLGDLREDVLIHGRYGDGEPAIVSRQHGSGQLMLLTTAPDPQWSDLGIRAAGLITWLHLLVDEAVGPPQATAAFTLGEHTQRSFGHLPAGGLVRVSLESTPDAKPVWLRLKAGQPKQPWPTDRIGRYAVDAAGAAQRSTRYVVNMPPEESRLTPITLPQLRERLGSEHVRLETPGADRVAERSALFTHVFAPDDIRLPLAGVLLALFLLELGLATRRRGSTPKPA